VYLETRSPEGKKTPKANQNNPHELCSIRLQVEEPLDDCQYYYCPVNQKLELELMLLQLPMLIRLVLAPHELLHPSTVERG